MANKVNRILVVDDEDSIRSIFRRFLKMKGFMVDEAKSGAEAIEKVKAETYDLVFLDIIMKKMDGLETFKELIKVKPSICVVMMTGFAVEEKVREAMKLGAFDYLYKPFDLNEIMAAITKVEKKEKLKPLE